MSDGPSRFYLQWNAVNWITVVLMATLGVVIMGMIAAGLKQFGNGGGNDD